MGVIGRLTRLTHAITLDGHRQNHRRLPLVFGSLSVGGIDFIGIVATAIEIHNFVIAEIGNQL